MCDVFSLLTTIVNEAQQLGKDKQQNIIVNIDPKLTLLGSYDELYSAFSNLVFNAVNYTPSKEKIYPSK